MAQVANVAELVRLARDALAGGDAVCAQRFCNEALALDPFDAEVLSVTGFALLSLGEAKRALDAFNLALALSPGFGDAMLGHADALAQLDRLEEALAEYDHSLNLAPADMRLWVNKGLACQELRRVDEALVCFGRALQLAPDDADTRWNKSLALLSKGDWRAGWPLYEARWQSFAKRRLRTFAQPLWLGETPLNGQTLLVHAEQGLGDTIQFCRFLPRVARSARQVIFEVQPSLVALISTLVSPGTILIESRAQPPAFDLHCPLMSLPLALALKPDDAKIEGPYLRPDPARVSAWGERLGRRRGLRVGIAWAGSKAHLNDKRRSMPVAALAPLFRAGAEVHVLQKDASVDDRAALERTHAASFHELDDFAETAALASCMDAIVSADTSAAHVAGALGLPLCLLLPFAADWRWGLDGTSTTWYPSAYLARQAHPGDWTSAIAKAAAWLGSLGPRL